MSRPEFPVNVQCPCCNQKVDAPSLEMVIDALKIPPQGARLLDAVWKGRGLPVPTQRICDAIWRDDPNGGPPEARMYRNFQWTLHHLRAALKGSGWTVVNSHYNGGYRLAVEQADDK